MIYTIIITITMLPGVILFWGRRITEDNMGLTLLVVAAGFIGYYWMGYYDGVKSRRKKEQTNER